jgi:Lrp/AsnC family leucine-responsive transcriptional regulator
VDQLDQDILVALQRDGRQSHVALARDLGFAPAPTLGCVRRLERSGTIRGYRAIVDPAALAITALTVGKLREHSEQAIGEFEKASRMWTRTVRDAARVLPSWRMSYAAASATASATSSLRSFSMPASTPS